MHRCSPFRASVRTHSTPPRSTDINNKVMLTQHVRVNHHVREPGGSRHQLVGGLWSSKTRGGQGQSTVSAGKSSKSDSEELHRSESDGCCKKEGEKKI
jgi:hypothetical protein